MNPVNLTIFLTIMLMFLSCKHDMPMEWIKISNAFVQTTHPPDSMDSTQLDSLVTLIETLQQAAHTTDKKSFEQLYKVAFDTNSECFNTVGKGMANPSFPDEAKMSSRKNAAKLNAEHWAALLKHWNNSDRKPFTPEFKAQILYSAILFEKEVGDTLFVLVQVPLGSIVYK